MKYIHHTDDPSDGYSQSWMNEPELSKDQCPECFSFDTISDKVKVTNRNHKEFGKVVDGIICMNCGFEF